MSDIGIYTNIIQVISQIIQKPESNMQDDVQTVPSEELDGLDTFANQEMSFTKNTDCSPWELSEADMDELINIAGIEDEALNSTPQEDDYNQNEYAENQNQTNTENTYTLKNQEQLDNLITNYKKHLNNLSQNEIEYYDRFIENYENSAKTTDLAHNLEAKKAFLALKKLDKYGYDTSKFEQSVQGRVDENSELLGQYYNHTNTLVQLTKNDYEFNKAAQNLYEQLYLSDSAYCCLLNDDKDEIAIEAKAMLDEENSKYSENIEDLYKLSNFRSVTFTNSVDNKWNNWNLEILITGDCEGEANQYLPKDLVVLHELYHAKQTEPGAPENSLESRFAELGAVIDSAARSDEIHKKLNNIPLDTVVEYPKTFKTTSGEEINLGRLINEFRSIKEQNGFDSWEQVFTSDEGMQIIKKYFN